jgi:hypothetical protein
MVGVGVGVGVADGDGFGFGLVEAVGVGVGVGFGLLAVTTVAVEVGSGVGDTVGAGVWWAFFDALITACASARAWALIDGATLHPASDPTTHRLDRTATAVVARRPCIHAPRRIGNTERFDRPRSRSRAHSPV